MSKTIGPMLDKYRYIELMHVKKIVIIFLYYMYITVIKIKIVKINPNLINCLNGVLVSILALCMVDFGFEGWSGQTNDY